MNRRLLGLGLGAVLAMSGAANATLMDRGNGLIYDDVLDITWLQNANYAATELSDARVSNIISAVGSVDGHALATHDFYKDSSNNYTGAMTWYGAMAWVDQLVYGGYDDWRLPTTMDGMFTGYGYTGTTTAGYNITTGEMGYMFYENLGNLGYQATDGTAPQPGWGLTNTGPFTNLLPIYYWSDTTYATDPAHAWNFGFANGLKYIGYWARKDLVDEGYGGLEYFPVNAWAVREGDSLPEPSTILLFGTGLAAFAGSQFRRKKK